MNLNTAYTSPILLHPVSTGTGGITSQYEQIGPNMSTGQKGGFISRNQRKSKVFKRVGFRRTGVRRTKKYKRKYSRNRK